jgi:hypothetical protein
VGESYELVVVDDASTDGTAFVAQRRGARLVSVAHADCGDPQFWCPRGERTFFIFVDADTIVNESVVRSAVEAMRGGAVGGGAAVAFDGAVPWYARLLLPVLVRMFRAADLAAGCFMFCTRSAFAAVNGFDETFFGAEELVMSRALKRYGKPESQWQAVTTSGRKLCTHSVAKFDVPVSRGVPRTKAVKQRQGMELWYAERRETAENA